jgi:hypothetical protein
MPDYSTADEFASATAAGDNPAPKAAVVTATAAAETLGPTPQKIRRDFRDEVEAQGKILATLLKIEHGRPHEIDIGAAQALAAAKTNASYPLDPDVADEMAELIEKASVGAINNEVHWAVDVVGEYIAVINMALAGLRVILAFGAPTPPRWHNLPVHQLAVEVIRLAKTTGGRMIEAAPVRTSA